MKKILVWGVSALLLGTPVFASGQSEDQKMGHDSMMNKDSMSGDSMKKDDMSGDMMKKDDMSKDTMKKDDMMGMKSDTMMTSKDDSSAYNVMGLGPSVTAFSGEGSAQAMAAKGPTVYFFAATWCPECQGIYKDIKAHYGSIPRDVNLVFVNYDKSADLKKKYGVTVQHTFVQIDSRGNKLQIWSGGTLSDILKKLGKS